MKVERRIGRRLSALAALALVPALLGAPAGAQACPQPDGLNGACWAALQETLPQFPSIGIPGSGICWDSCTPQTKVPVRVAIGAPVKILCGVYNASISVIDSGSGSTLLTGTLQLDYTRTWAETDPAGNSYQVWRLLAKGNLGSQVTPTCPVPTCVGSYKPFFYGYVDYALQCGTTSAWSHAVVLFHNCDAFVHAPVISSQPGIFHPKTTYAVVAPDTAASPFVPYSSAFPLLPATGPIVAEAVRNVGAPGTILCTAEEPISAGLIKAIVQACVCPLDFTLNQETAESYQLRGSCPDPNGLPSGALTIDTTTSSLPWLHLMTTGIGCWTSPATYPGKECAFVSEGVDFYHDSCVVTVPGPTGNFVQFEYGAQTTDGWMVLPDPVFLLTQKFVDLASNYSRKLPGSLPPPFVGSVLPTRHLIYFNVP